MIRGLVATLLALHATLACALAGMRARGGEHLEALRAQPELGGTAFELRRRGGGHTPGDMMVWLPPSQLLFTGDIVYVDRLLAVIRSAVRRHGWRPFPWSRAMPNAPVFKVPLRAACLAATLALCAAACNAQGLYLQSTHPASKRAAILEDDGHVAYLYLSAPGTFTPEREVVVYSRRPPVANVDWWELSKSGETAPIWRDIASREAVIAHPRPEEFTFRWAADGEAVALVRAGRALAFASASVPQGYSRAVVKASTLALPWDRRQFESTFRR